MTTPFDSDLLFKALNPTTGYTQIIPCIRDVAMPPCARRVCSSAMSNKRCSMNHKYDLTCTISGSYFQLCICCVFHLNHYAICSKPKK
jgi:hypothetical protein